MFGQEVTRIFTPKNVETLCERAKPYIGKEVTVLSWHENSSMRELYPDDEEVGFIKEFVADIPKSELL